MLHAADTSSKQIKGLQTENEQLRRALADVGHSLDASGTPVRLSAAAHSPARGAGHAPASEASHPASLAKRGASWRCVHVGGNHKDPVHGVAVSAGGAVATSSWDGTVRLFERAGKGAAGWGQAWSTPARTAKVGVRLLLSRPCGDVGRQV